MRADPIRIRGRAVHSNLGWNEETRDLAKHLWVTVDLGRQLTSQRPVPNYHNTAHCSRTMKGLEVQADGKPYGHKTEKKQHPKIDQNQTGNVFATEVRDSQQRQHQPGGGHKQL